MEYDIEILVPLCGRYADRIKDFKKYGILNVSSRRVLVSAVVSNEEIEGLDEGWPSGVDAVAVKNSCSNHIRNLYSYYADLSEEKIKARWLMRVDDDSCTDIEGLVSNLDTFYDHKDKFYLGDLTEFYWALRTGEDAPYSEYKKWLGDHERIIDLLRSEVECGIISKGGLIHMLGNERCMGLIKHRARLDGGHGDCALAVAAAISKFYPMQCPFISKGPCVEEFSIFGHGNKNHIHLISRSESGDNFPRNRNHFNIIEKFVDNNLTEKEKTIGGKKYFVETNDFIKLYFFKENYTLRIKFEDRIFHWMEDKDGLICVIDQGNVINRFKLEDNGNLVDGGMLLQKI